jgi:ribosomal protein L37E
MSKKSPWCPRCGAHAYEFHGIYKRCEACGYCPHLEHKVRVIESIRKNGGSLVGWESALQEIEEYRKHLKTIEQVKAGWRIRETWRDG